jgi:hypothetical protein
MDPLNSLPEPSGPAFRTRPLSFKASSQARSLPSARLGLSHRRAVPPRRGFAGPGSDQGQSVARPDQSGARPGHGLRKGDASDGRSLSRATNTFNRQGPGRHSRNHRPAITPAQSRNGSRRFPPVSPGPVPFLRPSLPSIPSRSRPPPAFTILSSPTVRGMKTAGGLQ